MHSFTNILFKIIEIKFKRKLFMHKFYARDAQKNYDKESQNNKVNTVIEKKNNPC